MVFFLKLGSVRFGSKSNRLERRNERNYLIKIANSRKYLNIPILQIIEKKLALYIDNNRDIYSKEN